MTDTDFLAELGTNAVVTRLKRISDAMIHDGRRLYKDLGLDIEPNWFAVFKLLRKMGPMSVTQISDAIGLSHPSVISIVNKMIKAGYLSESRGQDDKRRRVIELTPLAAERLPQFETVWDAGTAGFKRMMHDTDVLHMLDVLETRIAERGFRRRTLDELHRFGSVQVVGYSDRYKEDFARLNYDWIARYYTIEEHDHEQLDDPFRSTIEPGGEIFFVLVDGEVAGTVAMIRMDGESFELAKMAVAPTFQGYKLGDRLMEACIEFARAQGAKRIILESNTKQIAAINLYRKHGFVEVPRDPNSQYVRSNIRMELRLNCLHLPPTK